MFFYKTLLTVFITITVFALTGCDSDTTTTARVTDEVAPELISATVEDAVPQEIVLTFDEPVSASGPAGFAVTLNDFGVTISDMNGFGTVEIHLILPNPVLYPHTITLQYDAVTGDVVDLADSPNELASFGAITVTNNIPNKIETIAGGNGSGYTGNGEAAVSAQLNEPRAVFSTGTVVYVADHMNTAIRKFDLGGNISTVEDHSYIGRPGDIWISGGWIYVAGNVHCICRFQDGGSFERVGGLVYMPGFTGDGDDALLARMMDPYGVWASGNDVYVADTYNERIRKFTIGGDINTVAGDGSYYGDPGDGGLATAASVTHPYCIRESGGTFYVSTQTGRIRSFTEGGNMATVVPGGLSSPYGIDVSGGYIYIADSMNHAIKRVLIGGGTVEIIAGGNGAGYSGDGAAASAAQLNKPYGVHVENGFVYIADTLNHAIRRIHVPH